MKRKEFAMNFQARKATFLSILPFMFCLLFLASYPVNAQAELTITPNRLDVLVDPNGKITETLVISNTGTVTVTLEMREHSCLNPVDIPWVSEDPMSATMSMGDVLTVDVVFDAARIMLTGTKVFADTLCVDNDPNVDIPISMTIRTPAAPVPTLRDWGMILMVVLLGIGAVFFIRKRRAM